MDCGLFENEIKNMRKLFFNILEFSVKKILPDSGNDEFLCQLDGCKRKLTG